MNCSVCNEKFDDSTMLEYHLEKEINNLTIRYSEITYYKYSLQGLNYAGTSATKLKEEQG